MFQKEETDNKIRIIVVTKKDKNFDHVVTLSRNLTRAEIIKLFGMEKSKL